MKISLRMIGLYITDHDDYLLVEFLQHLVRFNTTLLPVPAAIASIFVTVMLC